MKIYDISQELFESKVFPGDQAPCRREDKRIAWGDVCNLTSLTICAHNGTHLDAPYHFLEDGDTVEKIPLEKTVGTCYVTTQSCDLTEAQAQRILDTAGGLDQESAKRILIRGTGVVTEAAARVFARSGIYLIGVESQTVGPEDGPMAVHRILLQEKTVLLEGLRLSGVEDGVYFLSAAPICLGGSDGAPCRAILIGK